MTARDDAGAQARGEAAMARATPLGRVGDPGDVAGTVPFLASASDRSAFMTGQILRYNGGIAMPW
jgi:3-oxoacyl-[acyl-carrier protein] reductase